MLLFRQLKQQLSQQLQALSAGQIQPPFPLNFLQLWAEVEVPQSPNLPDHTLLAWLKAQACFPHFFWQHRTDAQQYATLGAVRHFTYLEDASQFSQETGFRLFGGVQFEGACQFILPRLSLAKSSQKMTACLTLDYAFFAEEKAQCEALLAELGKIAPLKSPRYHPLFQQSACDYAQWTAHVEQGISHIQEYELSKVVLANSTTFTFSETPCPYALLAQSQKKNNGCYHFLWSETAGEAFIGSSPERLYKREDRTFYTEALAGTVGVSEDPTQTEQNALWLLNDHKNIYENLLVVDDICTHLADCAKDIQVGDAQIKRLRNVQHLWRPIHTTLEGYVTDADCLARLHPTAAVAGLPRLSAKQFIAQTEPFSRGWYAGTLGSFCPNNAEFCVTLRSAQLQGQEITLYAGAGIVEESHPDAEWQEIERKALAMKSLWQEEI
ncbi:isochorismate synthase [Pasteurellaceae bacterium Macca]|nr:isochorismate synthase [Pasteurellaceae bacterium Macca]